MRQGILRHPIPVRYQVLIEFRLLQNLAHGSVIEVYLSRLVPGRFEAWEETHAETVRFPHQPAAW